MRWFVRHSTRGGRCTAFNQNYKSKSAENVFGATSGQLKVKGNVLEVSEAYDNNLNREKKQTEKECVSKFDDLRKTNEKDKGNYVKNQLCKLLNQINPREVSLTDVSIDNDATSLYPSARWDEKSIYPKTKTGYAS